MDDVSRSLLGFPTQHLEGHKSNGEEATRELEIEDNTHGADLHGLSEEEKKERGEQEVVVEEDMHELSAEEKVSVGQENAEGEDAHELGSAGKMDQTVISDHAKSNSAKTRFNHLLGDIARLNRLSQWKTTRRKQSESKTEEEYDEADTEVGVGHTRLIVQPSSTSSFHGVYDNDDLYLKSCGAGIKGKLRDYQLAGLNWLIKLYENGVSGILADEMGLGKTLQAISLLGYLHQYRGITGPHIVVAPKTTLGNWINEIKRFCPILRAIKFHGNREERAYKKENMLLYGKFDICITSYEMAIKERGFLMKFKWRYIIIDEAHRIKNENSVLARTMRSFSSDYRLLITGTPLQNNLHELWALLNFLMPEIFTSADTFDELWMNDDDRQEVLDQLHKVLRPFLLRRLKADVERGLPPKKEIILKVGMSKMQKHYYRALLERDLDAINIGGEQKRLLNIAMQLRKCCNHPYLFQGAEPGPPYTTGEHLIQNAGKMVVLDKLLPKLKERGSRVLLFSQMTKLLDILEDYCNYRGYKYCRIDGQTSGDERESYIEEFNKPGSEKFIFLLSTRAGGLGINLATADIVIIYDSDWNPQVDLQAQDRAHRIGQKKEVQMTIEEKVIERAYRKLALDALVMQQGRLVEQRALGRSELLQMVRFGAELIFSSSDSTITDEDIDQIIERGEKTTAELNSKMQRFTEDAIRFKMDDTSSVYDFDKNESLEAIKELKKDISENWIEPPKREHRQNYSESQNISTSKPRAPHIPRMPQLRDFQFFNARRLKELFEKENNFYMCQGADVDDNAFGFGKTKGKGTLEPLTQEEQDEKKKLMDEGFGKWTRKDFNTFIRSCERYGRRDIENIASEMKGKTREEVERYAKVFNKRCKELTDHDRIIKAIEKGEARILHEKAVMEMIGKKLEEYDDPWRELKIEYGHCKGKVYSKENDRFLVCMMNEVGYGNWDQLKAEVQKSPQFRFDWFIKSRTSVELARRCKSLAWLIEKEMHQSPADGSGSSL